MINKIIKKFLSKIVRDYSVGSILECQTYRHYKKYKNITNKSIVESKVYKGK